MDAYPVLLPEMLWKNLIQLDVSDIKTVVKVDDTVVGIDEGLNAHRVELSFSIAFQDMDDQISRHWQ
jgi:hypothetical protein